MESAEHAWIGDQLTLRFEGGDQPAADLRLHTGGPPVTYGQAIALGGDFYGVVGAPISTAADPAVAFRSAWRSLVDAGDEVSKILEVMQEEIAAVRAAISAGREPSTAYAALGDSLSARWNRLTGGGTAAYPFFPMGRYLALAAENWDHFTTYAVAAYRAGHAAAMHEAELAGREHLPEKEVHLQSAYAMNAFADHFLTDLFSAGHLRAPRKELYDQVATPVPGMSGTLGSLLTRCMHDEDSFHGLHVTSAAGDAWLAYGDKRLLDSVSVGNRAAVLRAVTASMLDVWEAYRGGPHRYRALQHIPDLAAVADVTSAGRNFSPLFRLADDGVVARRNRVDDRADFSWTTDWWGWTTYALLFATHGYTKVRCYNRATGAFVGWLTKGGNNYAQLTQTEADAHPCTWYFDGAKLYLRKQTSGGDRYLGYEFGSADWELTGKAVVYHPDRTISLMASPERMLYLRDDGWLYWTDGSANANVLAIDLPLAEPSMTS